MCVCVRVCMCVILLEVDTRSQLPPPPRTNLQTKTKEHKGVGSVHASFFQGCQPLLFKDLTLALQSNKNLLVNWLASPKLFRFLMQLNVKCSIFNSLTVESSQTCLFVSLFPSFLFQSVTWGLLLKQVQRGLLTFPAGVFYYWGKKCLCDSSNYVFCLGNLTFWNLLQLCI